jgi:hypothetical protein
VRVRFARIVAHRLRSLLRSARVDAEVERELDVHLQELSKQYNQNFQRAPTAAAR